MLKCCWACIALLLAPTTWADPGVEFFESRIRPVLVEHCYKCHSEDSKKEGKLKGGLFLDTREGLLRGGDTGPAIVPGKPADSHLIKAIQYTDPDLQMPPKGKLPPAVLADMEKWVAMGAPDPRNGASVTGITPRIDLEAGRKFWAFQPLKKPALPAVRNSAWTRTPLDRFVLAKLEEKNIQPNSPAAKVKLIRRASFDLLGLPPAPEEVAAFVNDPSPDAYDKLLDRLLASPHYGERWSRHWLDVARFAESDGFEHDYDRPAAYQFRDFVIRALNQDLPYNDFVRWQIAGDEIAPDNWQAGAATGFLSAGVFPTQITEKEFEFTRYSQLDDMVSTMGNAMLGLTVGCARCHDHKFDPITSKDYYQLIAGFSRAIRNDIEVDMSTPEERETHQRQSEARWKELRAKVDEFEQRELPQLFGNYVATLKNNATAPGGAWIVLAYDKVQTDHGTKLVVQADGSLLKVGPTPERESYTLTSRIGGDPITAIRLEALLDPSLPRQGPGAGDNGNFALTEIEISAGPADGSKAPAAVKIASARATHQQNTSSLSIASSFDGDKTTGWAVDLGGIGKSQAAIFKLQSPVGFASGTMLTLKLRFDHASPRHLIGRTRLSVTTQAEPPDFKAREGPDRIIASILQKLAQRADVPEADLITARKWFAASLPAYSALLSDLHKAEAEGAYKKLVKVQITSEGLPPVKNHSDDRGYPHFYKQSFLLRRGDPNNKGEQVEPAFPAVLMRNGKTEASWIQSPPAGGHTTYRRTSIANWLTDTDNGAGPLLARVIVNRLWQHHLGRGIVATPNDFGLQGERPSHPELLEYLAADLVEHGWTLKRLHKLIMTSAVYMEESHIVKEGESADPHDVLLWRWQPRRLEAEPIRDAMLAVSGTLDPAMFGPGTLDQNSHRRSIYFTVKRSQLIPMMMVLDWPEPLNSIGTRPNTTVAPQALLFLNSPQAREWARGFAARLRGDSDEHRIEHAYSLAFGRKPSAAELKLAAEFLRKQAASYPGGGEAARTAAIVDFCQALLGANEFVYIE